MKSLQLNNYYSWKNILNEEKRWILIEENEKFLQFLVYDLEEFYWDSYIIINKKFFKIF